MAGWKYAYPVFQEGCAADVMGWPAEKGYGEVFGKLKEMGYEGVELLLRDAASLNRRALRAALSENGLQLAAVGTSLMQKLDHLFLLHPEAAVRKAAERQAMLQLEIAAEFGAVASIGKFRGSVSDQEGCRWADLSAVLHRIGKEAERLGVTAALEAQNQDNMNHLNTIQEMLDWLSELKEPRIHLHADTFHMGHTERNAAESIRKAGALYAGGETAFLHISDTERKVPGKGKLDFDSIYSALEEISYRGFISPEIRQAPDPETAARECMAFFMKYR